MASMMSRLMSVAAEDDALWMVRLFARGLIVERTKLGNVPRA